MDCWYVFFFKKIKHWNYGPVSKSMQGLVRSDPDPDPELTLCLTQWWNQGISRTIHTPDGSLNYL